MKATFDLDQLIDQAARHIQAQEGFTNDEVKNLKKNIHDSMLRYSEAIQHGKEAFMRFGDEREVAEIFHRVDHAFAQLTQSGASTNSFLRDEDYQYLLNIAVKNYERNELDEATNMLAVLAMLEPLRMQQYILLATIVWIQQGVEEASKLYDQFVKIFKDPLLYFYAADCFVHAENTHRAGKLLNEAIELCKRMTGKPTEELKEKIEAYKAQLHHQR